MPPKAPKELKEKAIKGDEAEEIVLKYMKQINRPYAAADVSANLKNKVTKVVAQKVLQVLAHKAFLTVKLYGKQSIYVYNQVNAPTVPPHELASLDHALQQVLAEVDTKKKTLRCLTVELGKKLAQPKTEDLKRAIEKEENQVKTSTDFLAPLRAVAGLERDGKPIKGGKANAGLATKANVEMIDREWDQWRKEWMARKKVYLTLLDMMQPENSKEERIMFEESIGIEHDTDEAVQLELGKLCKPAGNRPKTKVAGAKVVTTKSAAAAFAFSAIQTSPVTASEGDRSVQLDVDEICKPVKPPELKNPSAKSAPTKAAPPVLDDSPAEPSPAKASHLSAPEADGSFGSESDDLRELVVKPGKSTTAARKGSSAKRSSPEVDASTTATSLSATASPTVIGDAPAVKKGGKRKRA